MKHLEALAKANHVRLARAAVKTDIREGRDTVASVLEDPPDFVETMLLYDLLVSQNRWGHTRARRFLAHIPIPEGKTIGSLTERQMREVLKFL